MNERCSKNKHHFNSFILTLFLGMAISVFSAKAQSRLDAYIVEGLSKNESIKQQYFVSEKNLLALKEAKLLFRPNISLQANYTLAGGGRTVDFPIGDILNPVYSTLNELTKSSKFPQLENINVLLNPNNFYDAKFRTSMPIINAEIEYNKRIKNQQIALQEIEINLYKRELVKEIKTAYFKYLQAVEVVKIYQSALQLAQENLRINQSLFKNDKVNRTAVVRSENEVTKFTSQIEVAQQTVKSAKAYFNFLLNRNADVEIVSEVFADTPSSATPQNTDVAKREELSKLQTAFDLNQEVVGLTKTYQKPKLNAFLDLGMQGFDFKVNKNTPYYLAGVAFQWNFYSAGRDKLKTEQAEVDGKILLSQKDYVEQQLQLQLTTLQNSYRATLSQYQSALSQQTAATQYYQDLLKLYKEDKALFIELLEAQNQLVIAQLQVVIARYEMWIKAAEIERATASFSLPE